MGGRAGHLSVRTTVVFLPGAQPSAMKVRGQRECQDCGGRWSYYETGSVACPDCGSLRSVGVDERTRHTAGDASLDLADYRGPVADGELRTVADDLERDLRSYVRERGFIDGGDLRQLDDAFLVAHELLAVVGEHVRRERFHGPPGDDEEAYLLALFRAAEEGERLPPDAVPEADAPARGLACATAVLAYRDELTDWLDDNPDPEARRVAGRLRDRCKRVRALDGDVTPAEAEQLVSAARELGRYLVDGDEDALLAAEERLSDQE